MNSEGSAVYISAGEKKQNVDPAKRLIAAKVIIVPK